MERSGRAALTATLLLTVLLAGCTGEDVRNVANMTNATDGGDLQNLSASIDQCTVSEQLTECRVDTTNRLGEPVDVRITVDVLLNGTRVQRATTEKRIQAGTDFAILRFDPPRYNESHLAYNATVERGR